MVTIMCLASLCWSYLAWESGSMLAIVLAGAFVYSAICLNIRKVNGYD